MRQALQNTWVKWGTGLIFGIIILAFVLFFGPQSSGLGPAQATWVAKVGGRVIPNTELAAAFERYRRLSNDNARLDDVGFTNTQRQQTLAIAAVELLADRARDAGLAVSDDELRCFLVNWHRGYAVAGERICTAFPADYAERFRNYDIIWFTEADGSFTEYYDQSVRNRFNMASDDYEDHKEQELLARYYLASLAEAVEVSPGQVESVWQRRNTTVDLEFIRLDPTTLAPIEPSDDEVSAWAAANGAAVRAAYDADPAAFAEPRQVRIRRVYIRRPSEDSADYAEAQARYEGALARVTDGGEDFEAVARELTEIEREAEEGGDMGMRTADTISSDIWDTTTEMSAGEVRGVEQQYAWNIVKLEEVQEARTRPFEEVRDELAATLLRAELTATAAAALEERGARILALAADADSLADAAIAEAEEATAARNQRAAQAVGLDDGASAILDVELAPVSAVPVQTTGPFATDRPSPFLAMGGTLPPGIEFPPEPADEVPSIGSSRELVRIAFALTSDSPLHGEFIEVDGTQYIVRLAERVDASGDIPIEDSAAIASEIRSALVSALIGDENQLVALSMQMPGNLSPFVQQIIDEAFAAGDLKLRASFFAEPDPVDEI